jgi:UDP-N-acetylmuramyl tripeptide synthase
MQKSLGTLIGKLVRLTVVFRPNGGHALPGLVVDRLLPNYLPAMLKQLPDGVVFITGTNGKTTTTKMVVKLLEQNGKRVITNSTGSNMVRGVVSGLAKSATVSGKLRFDIAVLEVDEASARPLSQKIKPSWVLALNVSRDQLDRFGEVDAIANHIKQAMNEATEGIITNAADPLLVKAATEVAARKNISLEFFGAAARLLKFFPNDYEMAAVNAQPKTQPTHVKRRQSVGLADYDGQTVKYLIDSKKYAAEFKLSGQHNFLNGAAALALTRQLLPDIGVADLVSELAKVPIAFGRGETYRYSNGATVELVLVKNPASFRQALLSYAAKDHQLAIAINDNIADGRDVSWLWDVDFSSLAGKTVMLTTGSRAADMALRLQYSDIEVAAIEPNLDKALADISRRPQHKVIFATYTAMLKLYDSLNKQAVPVL